MSGKEKKVDPDDEWDKNPESDGEEHNAKANVKQVKADKDKPSKLKDLFNKEPPKKTEQTKPKKSANKDKDYKQGGQGQGKSQGTNAPNFFNSKGGKEIPLETTEKVVSKVEEKPAKKEEDIKMPTFVAAEGKIVDLNVQEDVSKIFYFSCF